jgi:EAL domain-containing protein (putative c-di-GMP-specific phosphodiesterase class I)
VTAIRRYLATVAELGDRTIVATLICAASVMLVIVPFAQSGRVSTTVAAGAAVLLISAVAVVGFFRARRAERRSPERGIERRVWRLFAIGLASWSLGCVPYLIFLATGGDVSSPAAWSQLGFLLAYPFWYRALWIMRQPALDESRRERWEGWGIELSVLGMLFIIVIGTIWESSLPALENTALLVPVVLDLLLLAALYNAIRRSSLSRKTAFIWFAFAFTALAVTDGLVTFLVTRGQGAAVIGPTMLGYMVAMALLAIAAGRPIRVTEAQAVLGPSKTLLAAIGLVLSGPATLLAPPALRPLVWLVAALLFWKLVALLRIHGQSDTDLLTGFLEPRAFARHVGGVLQAASSGRRALLVAVDLDGFGLWNGQNGFGKGDALLIDLSHKLEASGLMGGVWSRLHADRFAWIGIGHDAESGRHLAELVQSIASQNQGGLKARATFVILPDDADTAVNAMVAAEEGLAAAKTGGLPVVAFDRGRLDGVDYMAGYTASLQKRRDDITAVLSDPATIQTVFQPIVSLDDGRTMGFESLSRFRAEPQRPPDKWIAEAHAVGLGLEIEVECVRRAMALRHTIPGDAYLSVNMSPDAILAPEMELALGPESLEGLVIEITEHDAVGDYARLSARLADYRGRGAKVAIDDAGAGHASMRHVTQLNPDYIKIDRSLIHDIHLDVAKQAIVGSMVSLEDKLKSRVVAEGIETTDELRALRQLGVPLGQGYLLARPHRQPTPAPWSSALLELSDAARG